MGPVPEQQNLITAGLEALVTRGDPLDLANQPGLERFFAAFSLALGVQKFIGDRLESVYELIEYMKGDRVKPQFDHVDLITWFSGTQSTASGPMVQSGHFLRLSPWDLTVSGERQFRPGIYLETMRVLYGGFDPNSSHVIIVPKATREFGDLLMGDDKLSPECVVANRLSGLDEDFRRAYDRAVAHLGSDKTFARS